MTTAKFELTLSFAETPAGLAGSIEYATDLFDPSTISRFSGQLATLLTAAAAEPSSRMADLPLLGAAERQQLLLEWNDTAVPRNGAVRLHELFERQVALRPHAPAVLGPKEWHLLSTRVWRRHLGHLPLPGGPESMAPILGAALDRAALALALSTDDAERTATRAAASVLLDLLLAPSTSGSGVRRGGRGGRRG